MNKRESCSALYACECDVCIYTCTQTDKHYHHSL